MPWIAALAAAGGGIASSVMAKEAADDDRRQALAGINAAVKEYTDIGIPSVEAQQLVLEKYKSAGMLTPEMEQYFANPDSLMNEVEVDPATREAQARALNSLQSIADSGGLNLADKANLNATLTDINANDRGRREAILQRAAQTGRGGSGFELAAQLANAQDSAQNANQAGMNINAQAQQRALDALSRGGDLATSMGNQQFNQRAQIAAAQDRVNQYNTQSRQNVAGSNVGLRNNAQQYNLANNQNLANTNVDLANKEQQFNKGLQQTQFGNQMAKASGLSNAYTGQANQFNQNADRTQQFGGQLGSALINAGTGIAQYAYGDKKKKDEDEV